ncbi:hypothetical protein [Pararhizobium sp. PWRC1-1]|uniref:hypothetical protein n=1 Tax=Pararhizobium sp. PWRC1-1 TaxID=2804566 RepID=UPI003CF24959
MATLHECAAFKRNKIREAEPVRLGGLDDHVEVRSLLLQRHDLRSQLLEMSILARFLFNSSTNHLQPLYKIAAILFAQAASSLVAVAT